MKISRMFQPVIKIIFVLNMKIVERYRRRVVFSLEIKLKVKMIQKVNILFNKTCKRVKLVSLRKKNINKFFSMIAKK